jgi:ABC-type branched-subunit amino acid transport system substrate-binding protein
VKRPSLSNSGLRPFALVLALVFLVSWIKIDPGGSSDSASSQTRQKSIDHPLSEEVKAVGNDQSGTIGRQAVDQQQGSDDHGSERFPSKPGLECRAGRNGGNTDKGVTGESIRLATTAVLDGAARSLLSDSVTGLRAVINKVNKAGGICGRRLDLTVVNDGFDAQAGLRILRSFMVEGYFALPVVPSAEGLGSAIEGGWIDRAGIPVVGTDGMRQEQYENELVWPVASATVTAMRVMAKYGRERRGAKSFAIVYDTHYQFGKEGKDAFVSQVKALGGNLVIAQPLQPSQSSYASEVNQFNTACGGGKCDMIAMLLLPDTAEKWMARSPARAATYTAAAQTLFTDSFAQKCVQKAGPSCDGIAVWTGYNPPIGSLATKPGISTYIDDVQALDPKVDVNNQFLEGAYLGMSVFVEALQKVGPDLTRARLRQVMDSMTHTTDLTSPLSWAPKKHAANVRSQSFSIVVSQGTFTGWRNDGTGFLLDPAFGG